MKIILLAAILILNTGCGCHFETVEHKMYSTNSYNDSNGEIDSGREWRLVDDETGEEIISFGMSTCDFGNGYDKK